MPSKNDDLRLARHYLARLASVVEWIDFCDDNPESPYHLMDPLLIDMARAAACGYYRGAVEAGSARQAKAILKIPR